jgi:hypothetical protein
MTSPGIRTLHLQQVRGPTGEVEGHRVYKQAIAKFQQE